MLEGILLTIVLVVVFGYLIGAVLTALVDWNCRRTNTPCPSGEADPSDA
jgi:hypothetical protein